MRYKTLFALLNDYMFNIYEYSQTKDIKILEDLQKDLNGLNRTEDWCIKYRTKLGNLLELRIKRLDVSFAIDDIIVMRNISHRGIRYQVKGI